MFHIYCCLIFSSVYEKLIPSDEVSILISVTARRVVADIFLETSFSTRYFTQFCLCSSGSYMLQAFLWLLSLLLSISISATVEEGGGKSSSRFVSVPRICFLVTSAIWGSSFGSDLLFLFVSL